MSTFIAKELTASSPDEEVHGIFLTWIAENIRGEYTRPVLAKYGLENFDPNAWYPAQTIFNVLLDLDRSLVDEAFLAIGKQAGAAYPFDPSVKTLKDALMAINDAHHQTNRNIHPEQGFIVEELEPGILMVTNNNPWPGNVIYAMTWELGRRFTPPGGEFKVYPQEADEYGRAVFKVIWK